LVGVLLHHAVFLLRQLIVWWTVQIGKGKMEGTADNNNLSAAVIPAV